MSDEKKTIGMLLDINNLYGEHEGRLAPWMYVLLLGLCPSLVYVYLGGFYFIPVWLWILVNVIWLVRLIMIIPGRERYRKELFKKQINDDYMDSADLLQIKTIHPDGCIEFLNGTVTYIISAFNGTSDDDIQSTIQLRKFLETTFQRYTYDVHIHNINDSQYLRDYYKKVGQFGHGDAAKNFVGMIDHNIELAVETSTVQQTLFVVHSYKSDWKVVKTQIDTALKSNVARRYKRVYRVSDTEEINAIFNRDSDTVVDINELMRKKYASDTYFNSKVLAYDLPEDRIILQGKQAEINVLESKGKQTFHTEYDENAESKSVVTHKSGYKGPRNTV